MGANTTTWLLIALTTCTFAVAVAGIASSQQACADIDNTDALLGVQAFSAQAHGCTKLFGFWWYVIIAQFNQLIGLSVAVATGKLASQRMSWVGLFAVSMVLTIWMTEAFLTAETAYEAVGKDTATARARVTTAGCVMTSVANALIVIHLGTKSADSAPAAKAKITV